MKTFLLFLLVLVQLALSAQTTPRIYYLKAADKLEYQKYLTYCGDSVTVKVVQHGKATVINTNTLGLDYELLKAMQGEFGRLLKDSVWYAVWKPGTKTVAISIGANQIHIQRLVQIKVPRRLPSIPDFYASWKTGLIQQQYVSEIH